MLTCIYNSDPDSDMIICYVTRAALLATFIFNNLQPFRAIMPLTRKGISKVKEILKR